MWLMKANPSLLGPLWVLLGDRAGHLVFSALDSRGRLGLTKGGQVGLLALPNLPRR